MKLLSTNGTHAGEPARPEIKAPEVKVPEIKMPNLMHMTNVQLMALGVLFTIVTSLVFFIPAPAAAADQAPEAAPVVESTPAPTPVPTPVPEQMEDVERLAVGIYSVIHGHDVAPMTATMVGEVILNRVDSRLFPNTVDGVLRQPYQFGGLSNGYSWAKLAEGGHPDVALALSAAEEALEGSSYLPSDTLYVSDTEQGILAAFVDGLYFGR